MGDLNKRNPDKRKCVSSEALFDFVDIDHYVMPTLHLMRGIVNYLYKNMMEEAQAAYEGDSLGYVEAESIRELSCSSSRWDFHFHSYVLTIYVRLY